MAHDPAELGAGASTPPDPIQDVLGALDVAAVDGHASVAPAGGAAVALDDAPSRGEDTRLRRLLVSVLGKRLGRTPTARQLTSARDQLDERIEAARRLAQEQRRDAAEKVESARRERADAVEQLVASGDRLGALELRLDGQMPAIRRLAGVGEEDGLAAAVAEYAKSQDIPDTDDAALALIAEATAVPGAINSPEVDAARVLLGLPTIEREVDGGPPQQARYEMRSEGIVYMKRVEGGEVPVLVATFTAKIVREINRDDGAGPPTLVLEIEVRIDARVVRVLVPAAKFVLMFWPLELVGTGARVVAGAAARDRARDAIQQASGHPPRSTVYLHTGWREIGGEPAYLSGSGAIGPRGVVPDVVVELPPELAAFALPAPPTAEVLREAIRASLALLEVAGDSVTCISLGLLYRSFVPGLESDVSLYITGRTGHMKTTFLVLLIKHLGSGFSPARLANWSWTANALEAYAFTAKNALTPIDEAAPDGSPADRQRQWATIQRIFRSQGNQSGRGRADQGGALRSTRWPRGTVAATGEDVAPGESALARTLIVDMPPPESSGGVKKARLEAAQAHADAGTYALATAGYVRHLAEHHVEVTERAQAAFKRWRTALAPEARHPRTASNLAQVGVGWEEWLWFARLHDAISEEESGRLTARVEAALRAGAHAQDSYLSSANPVERFESLFRSAISSGVAHVAAMDGSDPTDGEGGLGWRRDERPTAHGTVTIMRECGRRVGWRDGTNLYLDLEAAVRATDEVAGMFGDGVALKPKTLGKRLHEAKRLVSTESDDRHTVRRVVEGAERRVYHLHVGVLTGEREESRAEPGTVNASAGCGACGAANVRLGYVEHGCARCSAAYKANGEGASL